MPGASDSIVIVSAHALRRPGPGRNLRQPPALSDSASTIRTTTRVVLLDIVVTDKSGKPVHGLKGHDFTVLEDDKAQQAPHSAESLTTVVIVSPPRRTKNLPFRKTSDRRLTTVFRRPERSARPKNSDRNRCSQRQILSQNSDVLVPSPGDVHDHHIRCAHVRHALNAFGDGVR